MKSTQVIDGYVAANADIMTDISAMAYGDSVIYLYAESTTSDGEAWYVYAPTATTGVVSKVDSKGTVTLRDGTEIAQSNLSVQSAYANPIETTQAYVFVLDTHGHYISAVPTYNLVYYTGSYSRTFGEYVGEETYTAQVISTDDGSVSRVPVLGSWWGVRGDAGDAGQDNLFGIDEAIPGYYVLGEPTTDGFYRPTLWLRTTNPVDYNTTVSGKAYDNSEFFNVNKTKLTDASNNVYDFAADEVEFIIVTGTGSNLSIATYTGVAEMLAGVGDAATTSAVLSNMAITFEVTEFGNRNVLKVFSADVDYRSTYLFIPYDIELTDGAWRQETGFGGVAYGYENAAYLNGSAEPVTLVFRSKTAFDRGFYSYEVDAAGYYTLTPVAASEWRYEAESIGRRGTSTYYQTSTITGMPASVEFPIADDVVVFDVRLGALAKEVDAISTLNALAINEAPNYVPQLAYTFNTDDEIAVIYVVEQNLGKVEVGADADSWTEASKWTIDDVKCVEGDEHDFEDVVSFTLTPKTDSGITLTEGAVLDVDLKVVVNSTTSTAKTAIVEGIVGKNNVVTVNVDMKDDFNVSGDYWYDITVEDVTFQDFTISLASDIVNKFDLYVKEAGVFSGKVDSPYTVEDLAPGETLDIGFDRASAKNLVAAASITGTPEAKYTVTFDSNGGDAWIGAYTPTKDEPIVVTAIDATYKFTLDTGATANYFYFGTAATTNNFTKTVTAGDKFDFEVKNQNTGSTVETNGQKVGTFKFDASGKVWVTSESAADGVTNSNVWTMANILPDATTKDGTTNNVAMIWQDWVDESAITNAGNYPRA